MGFLMIPLTTLYDHYIDRPKLSEQKNPFEYIVPPPLKGVGTKSQISETKKRLSKNFVREPTDPEKNYKLCLIKLKQKLKANTK